MSVGSASKPTGLEDVMPKLANKILIASAGGISRHLFLYSSFLLLYFMQRTNCFQNNSTPMGPQFQSPQKLQPPFSKPPSKYIGVVAYMHRKYKGQRPPNCGTCANDVVGTGGFSPRENFLFFFP